MTPRSWIWVLGHAPRSGREAAMNRQAKSVSRTALQQSWSWHSGVPGPAPPKNHPPPGGGRGPTCHRQVREQLVIDHTGQKVGGVTVFVYPSSSKAQRESRVTGWRTRRPTAAWRSAPTPNWAESHCYRCLSSRHGQGPDISAAIARTRATAASRAAAWHPFRPLSGQQPSPAPGPGLPEQGTCLMQMWPTQRRSTRSRNWHRAWLRSRPARVATTLTVKAGPTFIGKGGADFNGKGGADFGRR